YDEVEKRLDEIRSKPHYSVWIKMLWIGIATAALSQLFSGTYLEFLVVFLASIIGFWVRLFLIKKEYNLFMQSLVAAFVSVS
ncbi:threonine/serine exporter family protein, partial [Escherichia coli]|nr:threonine/serine exporter family protein [Escherichia coli]